MWMDILEGVVFGFLSIRYLFFPPNRTNIWYRIAGAITGLASIASWIRLGHLLGFWFFNIW